MQELEGVLSNLRWGGLVLALGSRGHHAGLEEDALERHIVLGKVVEHLCPYLLRHLERPVDAVFAVEHDLRLHNWDQTIVLQKPNKLTMSILFRSWFYLRGIDLFSVVYILRTWEMAA